MPFGDGTGPLGLGPYGRGFGRGVGRGFGYCQRFYANLYPMGYPLTAQGFPTPIFTWNTPPEWNEQFMLAEVKRLEVNIAFLQQQKNNLEEIINEKKNVK